MSHLFIVFELKQWFPWNVCLLFFPVQSRYKQNCSDVAIRTFGKQKVTTIKLTWPEQCIHPCSILLMINTVILLVQNRNWKQFYTSSDPQSPWGEKEDLVLAWVAFTPKIFKMYAVWLFSARPGASISHYCAPSHQNGTLDWLELQQTPVFPVIWAGCHTVSLYLGLNQDFQEIPVFFSFLYRAGPNCSDVKKTFNVDLLIFFFWQIS